MSEDYKEQSLSYSNNNLIGQCPFFFPFEILLYNKQKT